MINMPRGRPKKNKEVAAAVQEFKIEMKSDVT